MFSFGSASVLTNKFHLPFETAPRRGQQDDPAGAQFDWKLINLYQDMDQIKQNSFGRHDSIAKQDRSERSA
jgi:hypothetical protein